MDADQYSLRGRRLIGESEPSKETEALVDAFLEECPEGTEAFCCELPERQLTQAEVDQMSDLFRSIAYLDGLALFCCFGAADPCLVSVFEWDDFEWSDAPCTEFDGRNEQREALVSFIEGLWSAEATEVCGL